ncbi:MAG TPA: hypothetical protein VGH97_01320 [Thermoanaerobaculia bacterium]
MRKRWAMSAAMLLTAAAAVLLAENGRFEKTIAFPRGTDAKLDFTYEKVTVREVQCRNYPDSEDVEKARTKDHDDHSWLWWEFHADNRSGHDATIHFWVEILDAKGTVIKASDRSGTIDAGKIDDSFRVSTRLRTIDIADAPKVRIKAEILAK